MGRRKESALSEDPAKLIPRILNECQASQTVHGRPVKELVKCRTDHKERFMRVWCQCLKPIYLVPGKETVVDRVVQFASAFATYRDEQLPDDCDEFVEGFLSNLLEQVNARNKTVRLRTCQMIAEVMKRLAEAALVSDELWVKMTERMQLRMQDKVPGVRMFAASTLERLVELKDDDPTVETYRKALETDQSADVRRMVVMSMPALNTTVAPIVERTADISDAVRKAAYSVLGSKFPLEVLSCMQCARVLERGLADRVSAVEAECMWMLKDAWLTQYCEGDVFLLLRKLLVETNEKLGETVLSKLMPQEMIQANEGEGLRQFLLPREEGSTENGEWDVQFLDAEQALYWRVLCEILHAEAQAKGTEAATSRGAQAVVIAAAAADNNEALDAILPPTVADYVVLVNGHLRAGQQHRFAARQLLLLAKLLDFTDSANHKAAASLVHSLLQAETLQKGLEALVAADSEEFVGDGISLGGDKAWADAVAELALRVHAERGEFEAVVTKAVAALGQPCRDGGAKVSQWLHCLAVTSLLLENIKSLDQLSGCVIDGQEILHALLLPAVKHVHPEVLRVGVQCLGVFGCLATNPNTFVVRQLRLSLQEGVQQVQTMVVKAFFDLVLCHGAASLDQTIGIGPDLGPIPQPHPPGYQVRDEANTVPASTEEIKGMQKPLLEVLMTWLDIHSIKEEEELDAADEAETTRSLVAEGFAKLLLQSKLFPDVQLIEDNILGQLLQLYFIDENPSSRLQQCLSVFFVNYSTLSANNKKCIAKAFIPVMRSVWPEVYLNRGGRSASVLARKKRAVQLAQYMLQLLQRPLIHGSDSEGAPLSNGEETPPDMGHEVLAIRIAAEVKHLPSKNKPAGKAYVAMLAQAAVCLEFRASQQEEIKCMLQLLGPMMDVLPGDRLLLKELKLMAARLKALDMTPEQGLPEEQILMILDRLKLSSPNSGYENEEWACTPTPRNRRAAPKRTGAKKAPVVEQTPVVLGVSRSQRKSKTEALQRLSISAAGAATSKKADKLRCVPQYDSDSDSDFEDFQVKRASVKPSRRN